MRKKKEQRTIAIVRLELKLRETLYSLKKELLESPIIARKKIEELRKKYILNPNTAAMFSSVGMITEYTNLLKEFNKVMDGDLI